MANDTRPSSEPKLIADKLTEAQREVLLWLLPDPQISRYNDCRSRGARLKALERRGLCFAAWTPFPRFEHPWRITALGEQVRSILLERQSHGQ